MQNPLTSYWAV